MLIVALVILAVTGWVWAGLLKTCVRVACGEHYVITPGIGSAIIVFVLATMYGCLWVAVADWLIGWAQEVGR